MPNPLTYPGVYIEEIKLDTQEITPAPTSICAFVGRTAKPSDTPNVPTTIGSFFDFQELFGAPTAQVPLGYSVQDFFLNGGTQAIIVSIAPSANPPTALSLTDYLGDEAHHTGIYQLDQVANFNLLCIPPDQLDGDTAPSLYQTAAAYCAARRALLIVDPPVAWSAKLKAGQISEISPTDLGSFAANDATCAAVYFPRLLQQDPANPARTFIHAPSGAVAGIFAATDAAVGVWKAPAGVARPLQNILGLELTLTETQNGVLNPLGINCLRTFSAEGELLWGARTLAGSDAAGSEYKYIPVRRLALFIEASLYQGLRWVVFEPNAEPLWAQLRLVIGTFLQGLFTQGAFAGTTSQSAYFVKCDSENNTQADIANGVVNITVGFAPLMPAEFIVIQIQQLTGQSAS
jgi:phage tail sheath protein FI